MTYPLAVLLLFSACGSDSSQAGSSADGSTTIVVTTDIWADIVSNVACSADVGINVLIPPGNDPHAFEPSLKDREQLSDAALIVANGFGLEEGLIDTIEAAASEGVPLIEMAEQIGESRTLEGGDHGDDHDGDEHDDEDGDEHDDEHDDEDGDEHDDEHDDEDGDERGDDHDDEGGDDHDDSDEHGHDGADPHVWFDPIRVSAALPALADGLVEHVGLDQADVDECLASYQEELVAVDDEVQGLVNELAVDQRKLVTDHDSLGYFADRYGFEVVGTVIPSSSSMAETNPAQLEELAVVIETQGVPAIFVDGLSADSDSTSLADRLQGVELIELSTGSLGEESGSYVDYLRANAMSIVNGLTG